MAAELRVEIADISDSAVARALVSRAGRDHGLTPRAADELALAASELATNIIKYAGVGELLISADAEGVILVARDRGPGPPSEAELFTDGVSQGAPRQPDRPLHLGRGTGGGALRRLCDEVEILARPGGGAELRCRKRFASRG